jgi:hypothetical protein
MTLDWSNNDIVTQQDGQNNLFGVHEMNRYTTILDKCHKLLVDRATSYRLGDREVEV